MFKKTTALEMQQTFKTKKIASVMAVSLALTLGACGGGDGSTIADGNTAPIDSVLASIQAVPTVKEIPFDSPSPARCPTTSHPLNTMLCSIGNATNPDGSINYDSDGSSPIDLKALGYTEKEFFLSGKANVYDLDPTTQRAVVRSSGNPYTTRLMVRYPTDPAKFSGRVYIEILNASNSYDVENTWRRSWQHMINKGDAFIGITSKSMTANALKAFDKTRYADINWQVNGVDENGLFWDMLSQLGTQLRQADAKILGALKPQYVYLTGESQSGFYMNTYLTVFSDRVEKARAGDLPLFDGYLSGVGPSFTWLRSEPAGSFTTVPTKIQQPTKVPHIVYMSENENRMYYTADVGSTMFPPTPPYTRRVDSNTATDKFRFYEVSGTPHTDPVSKVLPINSEILKTGARVRKAKVYYQTQEHDDLQLTEFLHAMHENIHLWAAYGTPAPDASAKWMFYNTAKDSKGNTTYDPMRDTNGNALGGVRSPLIEVPLYRFYGQMQTGATTFASTDAGSMDKLPDATINSLYGGSCSTYLSRFNAAADAAVVGRYLVKSDADTLKAWAVTKGNLVTWADGKKCN